MKYLSKIVVSAVLIASLCAACSPDRGRVVAEVNGRPIYSSEVISAVKLEQTKYNPVLMTIPANLRKLTRSALEMLIQETLLLEEATRLGLNIREEELDQDPEIKVSLKHSNVDPDFWMRQQRRKLLIRKLIEQEVFGKIPVSDDEINAYYTKHLREFRRPLQYRARQILVETRKEADNIAKLLEESKDFGELARKYSISPDAERGGDLGFFSTKEFPHVFSEICAQLKKGEISDVKETEYGFQIFQLVDKRRAQTLKLEEVRDVIVDRVRNEQSTDAFAQWMGDIRTRGRVAIHEDALQEVDLHARTKK